VFPVASPDLAHEVDGDTIARVRAAIFDIVAETLDEANAETAGPQLFQRLIDNLRRRLLHVEWAAVVFEGHGNSIGEHVDVNRDRERIIRVGLGRKRMNLSMPRDVRHEFLETDLHGERQFPRKFQTRRDPLDPGRRGRDIRDGAAENAAPASLGRMRRGRHLSAKHRRERRRVVDDRHHRIHVAAPQHAFDVRLGIQ